MVRIEILKVVRLKFEMICSRITRRKESVPTPNGLGGRGDIPSHRARAVAWELQGWVFNLDLTS